MKKSIIFAIEILGAMKKFFKKTWFWMLSGVAMLLGTIFQSCSDISTLYGPPKVYGPPPPEVPTDTIPGK